MVKSAKYFIPVLLLLLGGPVSAQTAACESDLQSVSNERKERFYAWTTNRKVPNIALPAGRSLYEINAKNVVIVFWKTDCPYCEQLLPLLEKLKVKYEQEQLSIVAICLDDAIDTWRNQNRVKSPYSGWYHKCEGNGFFGIDAEQYCVFGIPTLLLLDRNHKISGHPKSMQQLEEMINSNT